MVKRTQKIRLIEKPLSGSLKWQVGETLMIDIYQSKYGDQSLERIARSLKLISVYFCLNEKSSFNTICYIHTKYIVTHSHTKIFKKLIFAFVGLCVVVAAATF